MTNAYGKDGLSSKNISRLTGALNNLDKFYNDPGTAKGGQYDVHVAAGWGDGATIIGGQVAFGPDYFKENNMQTRMGTIHEPLHLFGYGDRHFDGKGDVTP